jgi:hypothetical protein
MAERDPIMRAVMHGPRFIALRACNPDASKTSIDLEFMAEDGRPYRLRLSPSAASMTVAAILAVDAKQLKPSEADERAPISEAIQCTGADTGYAPEGQPILRLHLRNGLILTLDMSGIPTDELGEKIAQLGKGKKRPGSVQS